MSGFFSSRWVEQPAHVREADDGALPKGFRAAGVAAGIKAEGLDLGAVVCDAGGTTSAARFTRSGVQAPPVT
ncbi:MAG TPA: bifunctional glutamate N-acetyltransferase/amino-acid acetyltransferase ArgJ, partial [Solirubrobacteraceae bacterium]|nr:bifunctional glutamate N-acetyltransferase/amino-acid acetyltransferase ArgJ [Solirubrobacteraceae bacterium]